MKLTIRRRVIIELIVARSPLTASELCSLLSMGTAPVVLSSLASELRRMYDEDLLYRVDDWGPRGGYGYVLTMKAYYPYEL